MVLPTDKFSLGDALFLYRTSKTWDQQGMADTLHIPRSRYSLLENNKIPLTRTYRMRIVLYLPDFKHPLVTPGNAG